MTHQSSPIHLFLSSRSLHVPPEATQSAWAAECSPPPTMIVSCVSIWVSLVFLSIPPLRQRWPVTTDFHYSELTITQASKEHSGNYTCVPSNSQPASVVVHIFKGDNPAAMYHEHRSSSTIPYRDRSTMAWFLAPLLLLLVRCWQLTALTTTANRSRPACDPIYWPPGDCSEPGNCKPHRSSAPLSASDRALRQSNGVPRAATNSSFRMVLAFHGK
ncbi:AGAP005028-PA-like protein [Anopheles sinensis]|uniref:AGAP005028-PA-like protein n=1 Tax=Anopheles sinensis TaxID=74873 RepID=A0A084WDQ4_ANOSI|nr:AGAP005028-PA-like protein [Anopheles sinensis]